MIDNLDLEKASGVDGARFEHFQIAHLCCDETFRIEVKSRQIAWSFTAACEAVAHAILDGEDTIVVSINQDEAAEKCMYSKRIYENLKVGGLPRITRDSLTDLEFSNGARITSLTARAPRGRARSHVIIDEAAFLQDAQNVYSSVLPVISKGKMTLRIASSPWGQDGVFYEVYSQALRPYPGYVRSSTPWWSVYAFCTNVRGAIREDPDMPTADRVERYGNDRIKILFENMLLEDFEQEFCCRFQGSGNAWIEFHEIKNAQDPNLLCRQASCRGKAIVQAIDAIDRVAEGIKAGKCEAVLACGIDVGRKKDTTEIFFVGLSNGGVMPLRLMISMTNVEFEYQQEVITYALRSLPIVRLLIDQTGLGRNMAENIVKLHPLKAAGVTFTQASKHLWASELKKMIQTLRVRIPPDRRLAYQLHSVKRVVSGTLLKFDAIDDGKDKGHGDQFWALALAVFAGKQFVMFGNQDATGEGMISYW